MGLDRSLCYRAVVAAEEVVATLESLQQQYPISLLVMGNQTTSKGWKTTLEALKDPLRIVLVDERYSSLEARDRYWQMSAPKSWQRLLPKGMRQPDQPIDDIVAVILIERYLAKLTEQ